MQDIDELDTLPQWEPTRMARDYGYGIDKWFGNVDYDRGSLAIARAGGRRWGHKCWKHYRTTRWRRITSV